MSDTRLPLRDDRTLEELLAAGEVRAALILRGHWNEAEQRIAREAWEQGLAQGIEIGRREALGA